MAQTRARLTLVPMIFALAVRALLGGSAAERPVGPRARPVDGIMDNSFLIEEAYNQEAGVVQHIATVQYSRQRLPGPDAAAWAFLFTQEWPVHGQRHQLSYTVPYSVAESGGARRSGWGDLLLNYRYQAIFDAATLTALAPRASVVLPTGNADRGFGDDTLGAQFNLPYSTTFGTRWFAHLNAGFTWLPAAGPPPRRTLQHYNLGASLIYAVASDLHLLVECAGAWMEGADAAGRATRPLAAVISPGVRKAWNLRGGRQVVVGLAAPMGVTAAAPLYGVFLYFSFEHPFGAR